jgi:hypothetical protein
LTEAKVGPEVAPKPELSDAPSLTEVKCVIAKLGRGTAPGSNGLRPELFKTGGIYWRKELRTPIPNLAGC